MPENLQQIESRDAAFRRVVSMSTSLALALAYAWLGGFVRQPNGDFTFHWRWLVLVWAVIGFGSAIYCWRQIWPPGNRAVTHGGIVRGVFVLAIPGIWWLILPLRAQSGQHLWEVVIGLTAAALVLSFGAWLIFRLGKAFEDDKKAE